MSVLNPNIKINTLKILTKYVYILFLSATILLGWGCKTKKDKPKVKFMKNLTAHYNIYFNAKEALEESKTNIVTAQEDDFSQLLEIFPLVTPELAANESANLDEVIKRANIIAVDKYESNWLDDSYLLLADAEYLKADYYNAIEYYSYVDQTFKKEKKNKLKAYLGQVKSDFALDLTQEADSVLNMAVALKYKYQKDQVAAAQAKLAIIKNETKDAIKHLKDAVGFSKNAAQKTRWQYVLAQLQEIDGDKKSAIDNYTKVAKSNAAFEMAFNANLSKIRINENADGKAFDKIATLKKLLKEDKNRQLKDQIYYQIAKSYQEKKDYQKALEYYTTAAHTTPGSVKQKGLTYLKLAELNFETLKSYAKAQLYYDSTLQFLPKEYPNYAAIAKKANNLKYLSDRLIIIENEKNSLYLATLGEDALNKRVDSVFLANEAFKSKASAAESSSQLVSINDYSTANKKAGTFYFYNDAAMGQGLSEFKRKWGNRKLTDSWRISAENLASNTDNGLTPVGTNVKNNTNKAESRDSVKARLVKNIPYGVEAKQDANQKISTALYEIALFYKDVLKDEDKSAETFESIAQNFPDDKNLPNIYYQLYRLTAEDNLTQSAAFKQKILAQFPNSIYAKSISEPNFGKEREFRLNALKTEYANVFKLYNDKKYTEVLSKINDLKPRYSTFKEVEPTFAYLEALAIGHTQKTPAFLRSLNQIVQNYPDNQSITPLVQHQISFVMKNKAVFDQRPTALLAHDDNEYNQPALVFLPAEEATPVAPPVVAKTETPKPTIVKAEPIIETKVTAKPKAVVVVEKPAVEKIAEVKPVVKLAPEIKKPTEVAKPVVEIPKPAIVEKPVVPIVEKPKDMVFDMNERETHAIVIDINDPKQNVAVPFSFISQYLYSKRDPSSVKMLIKVIGTSHKFIIINMGLANKAEAELAMDDLNVALPYLMKDQTSQYKVFTISEDNLKLLTTAEAVNQYLNTITTKK